MDKCSKCTFTSVNKKYQLCTMHNWERLNPGKNYYQEQTKKANQYKDNQTTKVLLRPKKEIKTYVLKRTPLKPSPVKIKKMSSKKLKLESQYLKIREYYLRLHPDCKVCGGGATDIHHRRGRGEGYWDKMAEEQDIKLTCDTRFFLSVCRSCHTKIETNPEWAKENGYSLSRLEKSN